MKKNESTDLNRQYLQMEYGEVCQNFRSLSEIRFKLLAFLPLATGVGVVSMGSGAQLSNPVVYLLGLVVSIALSVYNARNDQHYNELVGRASDIERQMGLCEGNFTQRPTTWQKAFGLKVEHRWPIALIYISSITTWLFLALLSVLQYICAEPVVSYTGIYLFLISVVIVSFAILIINKQKTKSKNEITDSVCKMVRLFENKTTSTVIKEIDDAVSKQGPNSVDILRVIHLNKISRLKYYLTDEGYYWSAPSNGEVINKRSACQLVALLTDFPARWIFDIYTGQRGQYFNK